MIAKGAPSLAGLAFDRFLQEAGRKELVIPETPQELCRQAGVNPEEVQEQFFDVIERAATQKTVKNLCTIKNQNIRKALILDAMQVGSREKGRRAIRAAFDVLSPDLLTHVLRETVHELDAENAILTLDRLSGVSLRNPHYTEIFYKAIAHDSQDVQLHVLELLGKYTLGEGGGLGVRQAVLIKAASSRYPDVKRRALELAPILLKGDVYIKHVIRAANKPHYLLKPSCNWRGGQTAPPASLS